MRTHRGSKEKPLFICSCVTAEPLEWQFVVNALESNSERREERRKQLVAPCLPFAFSLSLSHGHGTPEAFYFTLLCFSPQHPLLWFLLLPLLLFIFSFIDVSE